MTASRSRFPTTSSSRASPAARVLSDNAFSIMVPVLDQILDWRTGEIRALLERNGLTLQAWEKARTDHVQIDAVVPRAIASE